MTFYGVLPKVPSTGERLGSSLGAGLSKGLTTASEHVLESYKNKQQQKQLSDYFSDLKEKHPGDRSYELLSDIGASPIPMDQKANFVKAILGQDPFRQIQQERLQLDSISSRYGRAITEIDNALKSGTYRYGSPEQKQAIELRTRLAKERDQLLGFAKAQEPEIGDEESGRNEDDEGGNSLKAPKRAALAKKSGREKFDPNNPKHHARREEVLKKTKGDRKKAGIVLSKEFDL